MNRIYAVVALLALAIPAGAQVCASGDLTLRTVKGTALTWQELDDNFTELGAMCSALSGLDAAVITGTPGANGTCAIWNTDGDLVSMICPVDTDTNTNAATICSGSLTYLDGEGNCDSYTLSGNTTELTTVTGAKTSGDCVEFDASGNLVAAGAACGSGSGGSSDSFATVNAPSGTDPVADSATDTLNLVATSPITVTGDSATDTLTFACPTCSTGAHTVDTTRTDEEIQDVAGAMTTGNTETGITVTYQDADGTVDFVLDTLGGDVTGTLAATVVGDDSHGHTGATVSALDTANVTTGTFADVRISQSSVTQHEAALSITESQITDLAHTVDTDTDDQTATEVPYTPTTGADWTDPDPAHAGEGLDDLAARLTVEEAKADDDVPEDADLGTGTADATTYLRGDRTWATVTGGSGDVVGPASSTTNAFALFADTTGKLLKNSTLTWDGSDLTLPTSTQIQVPYGSYTDPAIEFASGSGIYGEASGSKIILSVGSDGNGHFEARIGSGSTRVFNGNSSSSPIIYNTAATATVPNFAIQQNDSDTGLGRGGADDLRLIGGGVSGLGQTATETTLYVEQVNSPSAQTCADDGTGAAGTLSLTVSGVSYVALTNADANGCVVTLSETGATNGQRLEIVVVSNAGGTVDFADTAGVSETAGAFTAGAWDSITYRYASDRFVEVGRSDN